MPGPGPGPGAGQGPTNYVSFTDEIWVSHSFYKGKTFFNYFINAKAEALISICLCLIRLSQLLQNSEDKANAFIGP